MPIHTRLIGHVCGKLEWKVVRQNVQVISRGMRSNAVQKTDG